MEQLYAAARPSKHFFLEMFTRDIALEDCILDLVDNSIDGLVRSQALDLAGVSLLRDLEEPAPFANTLPRVEIKADGTHLSVVDDCGGIPLALALEDVFNFGYAAAPHSSKPGRRLGAYGIGMKRALFKIGRSFEVESRTVSDGFKVVLDVDEWSAQDSSLDNWRIPLTRLQSARKGHAPPGTRITVRKLRPEVAARLATVTFRNALVRAVSQTYMWFLDRYVTVTINGAVVKPSTVRLGHSPEVSVASDSFEQQGVRVRMFAGIGAKGAQDTWESEAAGWYVLCSGRVVAAAEKSDLTGWGRLLPAFHPKYSPFVGFVFFDSDDPVHLPWTTTKRGLNRESPVYEAALNRMHGLARPVLTFLNQRYRSDEPREDMSVRAIAESVKPLDASVLSASTEGAFQIKVSSKRKKRQNTVSVQFDADRNDLDAIRRHLDEPRLSSGQIGSRCLDYFMRAEGLK